MADPAGAARSTRSGPGIVLVACYGLLALAATGRSILQISEYFSRAPLAYLLSALAAVIYVVATVALARGGRSSRRVALAAISVELAGVLLGRARVGGVRGGVPGQDGVVALRFRVRVRAAGPAGARTLVAAPHRGRGA